MQALVFTIHDHYKPDGDEIKIFNPGNQDHYFQFSGGGDIYIGKQKELLVIYSEPELSKDVTLSPTDDSESVSGLTIEEERGNHSQESLQSQLVANSTLACVSIFINKCKLEYDADYIKNVTKISGYSSLCNDSNSCPSLAVNVTSFSGNPNFIL